MGLIWVNGKTEYLCKDDWISQIALIRLNNFVHARRPCGLVEHARFAGRSATGSRFHHQSH
jgi:hypothetical protein